MESNKPLDAKGGTVYGSPASGTFQPNGPPVIRKVDRFINKMSLIKSPANEEPIRSEESEGSTCAYYVVGKNRVEKIQ